MTEASLCLVRCWQGRIMSQRFLEEGSDKLDVDAFVPGSFGLRTRTRLADIGKEGGSKECCIVPYDGQRLHDGHAHPDEEATAPLPSPSAWEAGESRLLTLRGAWCVHRLGGAAGQPPGEAGGQQHGGLPGDQPGRYHRPVLRAQLPTHTGARQPTWP